MLDWSGALLASEAEIARGQRAQDALNSLARVSGWGQHRTFKHPPAHIHVVERGDTLYSIARHYETSVASIILANIGAEPIKLYRGTELVIPNPGSGFRRARRHPARRDTGFLAAIITYTAQARYTAFHDTERFSMSTKAARSALLATRICGARFVTPSTSTTVIPRSKPSPVVTSTR